MSESRLIFPASDRVIYTNNPLREVVCQLRYPPILRVMGEIPALFQERIRSIFPEYAEEINAMLPAGLPPQVVQLLSGSASAKRHRFHTKDGHGSVILDGQNLTFSTTRYESWEEFSSQIWGAIDAFIEVYSPTYLSRIGLRYQNAIAIPKSDGQWSWKDYLRPQLVGPLSDNQWSAAAFEYAASLRCHLEHEPDRLLMQYGLTDPNDSSLFMIDFDYYVEGETGPSDAKSVINRLHSYSGAAFRWAIVDGLHQSLGPQRPNASV